MPVCEPLRSDHRLNRLAERCKDRYNCMRKHVMLGHSIFKYLLYCKISKTEHFQIFSRQNQPRFERGVTLQHKPIAPSSRAFSLCPCAVRLNVARARLYKIQRMVYVCVVPRVGCHRCRALLSSTTVDASGVARIVAVSVRCALCVNVYIICVRSGIIIAQCGVRNAAHGNNDIHTHSRARSPPRPSVRSPAWPDDVYVCCVCVVPPLASFVRSFSSHRRERFSAVRAPPPCVRTRRQNCISFFYKYIFPDIHSAHTLSTEHSIGTRSTQAAAVAA